MTRVLTLAAVAVALDAYTTLLALHAGRFQEASAGTAALISALGTTGGVLVTVAARLAVLALLPLTARVIPRARVALVAIGVVGCVGAWLIVLSNIRVMA